MVLLGIVATGAFSGGSGEEGVVPLRVAADPENMPFSNRNLEGFENRIANVLAAELGTSTKYVWWGQRRGFIRNTLKATLDDGRCEVVIGIPKGYDLVSWTRPYYRSTYVFVYRAESDFDLRSLDDPILKDLKIGVHLIGNDYTNPPPVHELGRRGIVENVSGFDTFYSEGNTPGRIIDAVANGEVDVAIVWGPIAGYYAKRQSTPMKLVPVPFGEDDLPFAFDISVGVRHGEKELKSRLEKALEVRKSEILQILEEYGVPLLPIEE
jgi:quinoprotein dehydrogenase-associated probable ABC transporter substrate-binding protein